MVGIIRCAAPNNGRRRCTVYQSSVVIESDSESLSSISWIAIDWWRVRSEPKRKSKEGLALDSRHYPIKCQECFSHGIWERRLGTRTRTVCAFYPLVLQTLEPLLYLHHILPQYTIASTKMTTGRDVEYSQVFLNACVPLDGL
jgi:hypothetical protein